MRRDYLRNRGLYDWQRLFYAAEYRGCLCGGDVGGYGNRGILVTPRMAAAGEPCCAELSFRICLERGMESDVACMAESGVLLGCEVDGMPVDVDVATGTDISQSVQGVTRTAVLLRAAKLTSGVWHQVRMSFGAVAAGSAFRFMPTVIRDVKNCFWIDDVEVRRTAATPMRAIASRSNPRPNSPPRVKMSRACVCVRAPCSRWPTRRPTPSRRVTA